MTPEPTEIDARAWGLQPDEIEKAAEIEMFAVEKLRGLELKHQADPGMIFAQLLGKLIDALHETQLLDRAIRDVVARIGGPDGKGVSLPRNPNEPVAMEVVIALYDGVEALERDGLERTGDYQEHDEVLAAIWEGVPPEGIDHQATLELIAALHRRPGTVALASDTEPDFSGVPKIDPKGATEPGKKKPGTTGKEKKNERKKRQSARSRRTGTKPAGN